MAKATTVTMHTAPSDVSVDDKLTKALNEAQAERKANGKPPIPPIVETVFATLSSSAPGPKSADERWDDAIKDTKDAAGAKWTEDCDAAVEEVRGKVEGDLVFPQRDEDLELSDEERAKATQANQAPAYSPPQPTRSLDPGIEDDDRTSKSAQKSKQKGK